MLTPSFTQSKVLYQPNGFPVHTTKSGIQLTFQSSDNSEQNGRFIADETWQSIGHEYSYLNPEKYQEQESFIEDWFAIKHNIRWGDAPTYKNLFTSMSMQQLCEKEQHIQQLIDAVNDFISTDGYKQYVENHRMSSGGPGGGGYQPLYRSLLSSLLSFLSVIAYYKDNYQQTMKHVALLHNAGHDIATLFLDSNTMSHV